MSRRAREAARRLEVRLVVRVVARDARAGVLVLAGEARQARAARVAELVEVVVLRRVVPRGGCPRKVRVDGGDGVDGHRARGARRF